MAVVNGTGFCDSKGHERRLKLRTSCDSIVTERRDPIVIVCYPACHCRSWRTLPHNDCRNVLNATMRVQAAANSSSVTPEGAKPRGWVHWITFVLLTGACLWF